MPRHLLDLFELTPDDFTAILDRAEDLKREWSQGQRPARLPGRTLGLIFEKPSLRTRVSFETAMVHLGGKGLYLNAEDVGMGSREPIEDCARVLSEYLDALAIRAYRHELIETVARYARVPVINALSDLAHPCQALADMMTLREEFGRLDGLHIVFVGDGNNVARSLAVACALGGARLTLAAPPAYAFPDDFAARIRSVGRPDTYDHQPDPSLAVAQADAIYTDVWISMGQEEEATRRLSHFQRYQVDEALMAKAPAHAVFLHCLPARRGEEVTASVIDGSASRVIAQASNRMHVQKGLLSWLLA